MSQTVVRQVSTTYERPSRWASIILINASLKKSTTTFMNQNLSTSSDMAFVSKLHIYCTVSPLPLNGSQDSEREFRYLKKQWSLLSVLNETWARKLPNKQILHIHGLPEVQCENQPRVHKTPTRFFEAIDSKICWRKKFEEPATSRTGALGA
jgi:hypothetical protein